MSEYRKYRCLRASVGLGCEARSDAAPWPPTGNDEWTCRECGSCRVWDDPDADEDARLIKAALAMADGTPLPLDEVKRRLGRT